MKQPLSPSELQAIALQLEDFSSGFSSYLSMLRGENDEMSLEDFSDLPWKPVFFLLAGSGRVQTYRSILRQNHYDLDEADAVQITAALEDAYEYVLENKEEILGFVNDAFEFLLQAYRKGYVSGAERELGWNFDDYLEERDLIEFFLIGVEEQFATTPYAMRIFEEDCRVRERINELGLEAYAEEYFPGRLNWLPQRFWWHHRPEERIPHPDGLET